MTVVLPYNPLAQISETFSWKTAVNPCWSAEERISLLENPNLSITYSYALDSDVKLTDFYNFSETWLGSPIKIPMWSSPHFHSGVVLSTDTSISLTDSLLHHLLSPGDEVIIWKSGTNYRSLIVDTISANSISFTTTIGSGFYAFYLLPLLTGRFNKAVNFTKGSGGRKRANLVFEVLKFTIRSSLSLTDKVLQSSEFSTASAQDREIVSSDLGVYENLFTSSLGKSSWRCSLTYSTPLNYILFLYFLNSVKGRARPFLFTYKPLSPTYYPYAPTVFLSSDSVTINHSHPRRFSISLELEGKVLDI
jgi:hypothetical protein